MSQRSGMMTSSWNLIFALFLLSCAAPNHLPNAVSALELNHICLVDEHCQNGGKCITEDQSSNQSHCNCKDGFTGPRCAHHCPYDCKNGGYCTVTPLGESSSLVRIDPEPKDFMCKCFGRFSGPLCETPYMNCGESGRCFNGGVCMVDDTDGKRRCSCPAGWDGDSCESENGQSKKKFGETLTKTKQGKASLAIIGVLLVVVAAILAVVSNRRRDPDFHFMEELEYDDFFATPSIEDERTYSSKKLVLNVV
jgi:hypothetical protein